MVKNQLLISVLTLFTLLSCSKKTTGGNTGEEWTSSLKVATYNIEYDNINNPANPWGSRKTLVKEVFDKYQFDIMGVQEPYKSQLDDMSSLLPQYGFVGTDVRGGTTVDKRLSVTIFYKKDRIEIKEWGKFWLSPTPTVLSMGWDAGQYRICTWAKAMDKATQKEFFFFSTHLDVSGTEARTKGAQLLLDTIPVIAAGYPAILVGDFNSTQNTSYYKLMVSGNNIKDTYDLTYNKTNAQRTTYNGYNASASGSNRIDHVFTTTAPQVKINSWAILIEDAFNGKYASDHFPVMAEISFPKP